MTEPGRPPSASQLTLSQIMDQHHTCRAFGQAEIRRRHRLALRDALAEGAGMTAPRLATEIDALVWDVAHLRDPDPATTLRLYAAAQRLTAVIREQFDANNDAGSEDGESGEGRHAGVADLERFLAGLAQFTRLSALDRCRAVPDMRGLAREALATEYGVALIQTGMRPADLARELGISTPRVRAAMRHGRSAEARRVVGLTAAESRSSDGRTQRDG